MTSDLLFGLIAIASVNAINWYMHARRIDKIESTIRIISSWINAETERQQHMVNIIDALSKAEAKDGRTP